MICIAYAHRDGVVPDLDWNEVAAEPTRFVPAQWCTFIADPAQLPLHELIVLYERIRAAQTADTPFSFLRSTHNTVPAPVVSEPPAAQLEATPYGPEPTHISARAHAGPVPAPSLSAPIASASASPLASSVRQVQLGASAPALVPESKSLPSPVEPVPASPASPSRKRVEPVGCTEALVIDEDGPTSVFDDDHSSLTPTPTTRSTSPAPLSTRASPAPPSASRGKKRKVNAKLTGPTKRSRKQTEPTPTIQAVPSVAPAAEPRRTGRTRMDSTKAKAAKAGYR